MTTASDIGISEGGYQKAVAEKCRRRFSYFCRNAWDLVERNELLWNWHLNAICEHLQSVADRDRARLVICVPPGTGKSLFTSVFWPAWLWLRDPTLRMQFLSGSNSVRKRDSKRTRDIVKSQWYASLQQALGRRWSMSDDQNTKVNFDNSHGGKRQSLTIGGKITGDRADLQVCDDPYDVKEAIKGSEGRIRERMTEVIEDWDSVLANRLNDERRDPRVLIMQRLHPADLAGELISRGWPSLVLPAEYEPGHPSASTDIDPREEAGELLFERRLDDTVLRKREKNLIPGQYAAQYQQRPQSRSGGIIDPDWLERRWRSLPDNWATVIQSWDLRHGGQGSGTSYAVGQLWGVTDSADAHLIDQKRGRWDPPDTLDVMRDAQHEPLWEDASTIVVEEKADGRAAVPMLKRELPGVEGVKPTASKEARLQTVASYFKSGDVVLPADGQRAWLPQYVDELQTFPASAHDDQVDATTQALTWLFVDGHWDDSASSWGFS